MELRKRARTTLNRAASMEALAVGVPWSKMKELWKVWHGDEDFDTHSSGHLPDCDELKQLSESPYGPLLERIDIPTDEGMFFCNKYLPSCSRQVRARTIQGPWRPLAGSLLFIKKMLGQATTSWSMYLLTLSCMLHGPVRGCLLRCWLHIAQVLTLIWSSTLTR